MTRKVDVALGDRSYSIEIGQGLLGSSWADKLSHQEILIVSDSNVAPLYLNKVQAQLTGKRVETFVFEAGERSKTLAVVESIWQQLLQSRFSRKCLLIALGGGVVGDMTGYAAACYQRGVDFLQIPTTLLAQVDSSVGGKTGVNHPLGKNMIGAFHQPISVLIDTDTLETLPARQWGAGMAEVVKYGLLGDADFVSWLSKNAASISARDPEVVTDAIAHCCQMKADIVARDEREGGQRALLNLGHTFGHAIEAEQKYQGLLHGEAVAVGMCMAADLAARLGWDSQENADTTRNLLAQFELPTEAPSEMTADNFMAHMGLDKKVEAGKLRLVLPKPMGNAVVTGDFDPDALAETLRSFCA